jgi:hypothetical protein
MPLDPVIFNATQCRLKSLILHDNNKSRQQNPDKMLPYKAGKSCLIEQENHLPGHTLQKTIQTH